MINGYSRAAHFFFPGQSFMYPARRFPVCVVLIPANKLEGAFLSAEFPVLESLVESPSGTLRKYMSINLV